MSDQAPKVPEEMFREVKYYAVGDIDPQVPRRPCRRVPGPSPLPPRVRARAQNVGAPPPGPRRAGRPGSAELGRREQNRPGAGGQGGDLCAGIAGTFGRAEVTWGGGLRDP